MLVVDVEKFVSPEPETWFSVDAKEPVGHVLVEIVEGSDMKPSDMNGLADPYIKGKLGAYRFKTKTQRKTLSPKWYEEFKIPITSWDSLNLLEIGVRDKDHIFDDTLGDCCVKINDFRDGQRHDMWLPLEKIKTGRLHLAINVIEAEEKVVEQKDDNASKGEFKKVDGSDKLPEKSKNMADGHFEPIDVEGQKETGIWVHHPGADVAQVWESRKGKIRIHKDSESVTGSIRAEPSLNDSSSTDESLEGNKPKSRNMVKRGFHKVGSLFHRSPRPKIDKDKSRSFKKMADEDCNNPHENIRAVNKKEIGVKLVMEDNPLSPGQDPKVESEESPEGSEPGSPDKRKVKGMVKGILKHTGNSARGMMHAVSSKGSNKERDTDLVEQLDCSGELGPIGSPGYRPDGKVSPNGPGQMDSGIAATSPVIPTGEVNVDDPNTFRIDGVNVNGVDKAEVDDFTRTGQETSLQASGDQGISSLSPK